MLYWEQVDSKANCFVDAVWEAARDANAVVEHKRRIPRQSLQRSILRAIDQRRRAFTSYREAQGGAVHEAMDKYVVVRKRVRHLIRRNRRRVEQRNIEEAVRNFHVLGRRAF